MTSTELLPSHGDTLRGVRVVAATSGHAPLDDRIFYKEARTLARAGADVTLLHPDTFTERGMRDGVHFASYHGGGALRRRVQTVAVLEHALEAGGYDVIHCHEPDVLLAALRVKRRRDVRVIYDSHEMWGAVAAGRFPRLAWGVAERAFGRWEQSLVARCDGAIGASWDISAFLARHLPPDRVATILNVPVTDVFGEPTAMRGAPDPLILAHDGSLSFDRGLRVIAEAVRLVAAELPVRWRIVGDVFGEERHWLDAFIERHHLEGTIERTGWLSYEAVGRALAGSHVGLIALQFTPNNIVTSSNKVFNYLLCGMPFIGPHFRRSKQRMVREDGCGLLADSASPTSYAEAIGRLARDRDLLDSLAERAVVASCRKYRWSHMEPILLDLYQRVLQRPRGA